MIEPQNTRAEILGRIRFARSGPATSPVSAAQAWQSVPRKYRQSSSLDRGARIGLLEDRLRDYGVGTHHAVASSLAQTLAAILQQRSKQKVLLPHGIPPAWLPEGFTWVQDDALAYETMEALDGVLTASTLAIASTGTIVLTHALGQGRRALTLIPDYHLCVVDAACIVETVPEAMAVLEAWKQQPITWISGPSATADIEMTRIQGVHGPRVLDVVLVA